MSTDIVSDPHSHPPYGSEPREPSLPCRGSIVARLKLSDASHLHADLRPLLDQSVEDHYHTHGLDLTLMELERQMHRVRRFYACALEDAHDGDRALALVCRDDRS
jgi:hypothetical protein